MMSMHPILYEILILCLGVLADRETHKSKLSGEYKMSINSFEKTFGQSSAKAASNTDARPKAQFWLNIGYTANEGTEDAKFISLPTGIPLDTQEHLATNSSNEDFRAMRCAQNDLLDQLLEFAKDLEPGAEGIIQLQVQLRRVKGDAPAIASDENKYSRKLSF
jgi:hypothetical protein